MNETDKAIQEELLRRTGTPPELYWVYTDDSWCDGARPCWELVERSEANHLPIIGFRENYTNVLVFPDGRLKVRDNVFIQCASVEKAKEIGMSTYLLTQEGG